MRVAILAVFGFAVASFAVAQPSLVPVSRVSDDAKVVDRVAEIAKKDLPTDILRRLVTEDIELLRGKRADGTYDYASYERMEGSRQSDSFSISPSSDDRIVKVEVRGTFVFRVVVDSPSRRMLVTKNRHVFLDHLEIEYIPQGSSTSKLQNIKVEAWVEPGEKKDFDLTDIPRSATVRVFARGDKAVGYGNINVTVVQARVFDHTDSPYADAVVSENAILRALDHGDVASMRSMASRIVDDLRGHAAERIVDVTVPRNVDHNVDRNGEPVAPRSIEPVPPRQAYPPDAAPVAGGPVGNDVYEDLVTVEDLLTGTDAERRQGMEKLHQLIRRLRTNR